MQKSVFPYEPMWVNYLRLDVQGLDGHTSSISESCHFSMKNGIFAVGPNMSAAKATSNMCEKANHRAHNLNKKISAKANKVPKQKDSKTRKYLTDWCENYSKNERELMNSYHIVQTSPIKYLLVKKRSTRDTADDKEEKEKGEEGNF